MLAATLGLTADTQDFAASHLNEILSLTEKTIVPVQLGSEWILVPGSPKDGWTDRIPARNRFNRNFAECFFGLPELDLDSVVYGFGNEPELAGTKLSPWLGNAPRNGDILEIWHTFNEIDRLYVYIDDCFSSNGALLAHYHTGKVTSAMLSNWQDGVRITQERTEALCRELDRILGKYYPQIQLDEFKRERFESMLETNARWGRILEEAAGREHL